MSLQTKGYCNAHLLETCDQIPLEAAVTVAVWKLLNGKVAGMDENHSEYPGSLESLFQCNGEENLTSC